MIELLVVCAIIVVITGLILVDNNKFGGEVTLENLAYDVALTVRQTQVYGIAVERFGNNCAASGAGNNCFDAGYGMHFSLATPSTYILFNDEDGTGIYDATANPSEVVESDDLTQGYSVSGLCVIPDAANNVTCDPVNDIEILYERPEPEAYISASQSGTPASCLKDQANCNYEAQITLLSPKGDQRTVVVDATGQISVQLQ